ncbi:MAG: hypothetical protein JWM78_2385 [Verrucomicrobiaceae bacterium]|nr:hypothetical protein [Verrucomicrobiaceae bacterium]
MKKTLQISIAGLLCLMMNAAIADVHVFNLNTPNTQEVVDTIHESYGDKLHAELVQEKLVVVGSKQQLNEVSNLLARIDPMPARLRLQLREQPPADEKSNVITYSSNSSGAYTIDSVEGAFVSIDYSQVAQQVSGAGVNNNINDANNNNSGGGANTQNGWWVEINNTPVEIRSLTLQIRLQNNRSAMVTVSYTREENQERRVYGNTLVGELGSWVALLPQPVTAEGGSISSGAKAGSQIYLRIDKQLAKAPSAITR